MPEQLLPHRHGRSCHRRYRSDPSRCAPYPTARCSSARSTRSFNAVCTKVRDVYRSARRSISFRVIWQPPAPAGWPERRLLFGHRQHRAQVLIARLDACAAKAAGNIGGPAPTIAGVGRDQRHQSGFDVGGAPPAPWWGFTGTARQRQHAASSANGRASGEINEISASFPERDDMNSTEISPAAAHNPV